MKFVATLTDKKGEIWDTVEFESRDPDSVAYAMGYISQAIKDGHPIAKIENK